ncbi:MAG: hypothetical protein BroJett011_03740 [Chloroflexota bacterium]|nr:MAG: hypothetical protein BroJett011_03740 [Chloroflexota bacterium]
MNRVPPAKGLSFLTWAQIEQIDARLASLAAYAQASGAGVQMFLQVNENGMLVTCGQTMLIEKIKPGR